MDRSRGRQASRSLLPVAAAAACVVAATALAGCSGEAPDAGPTRSTATASASPEPAGTATDGAGTLVDLYLVGDTPLGERLYREPTRVTGGDVPLAAATALTAGDPRDPDYRTLWPSGRPAGVAVDAGAITLAVPDSSWTAAGGLTPGQAGLAVEQMVRTLQAASGTTLPLRATLDGRAVDTLLGVTVGTGLRPGPDLDVLSLMSIGAPAEGAVVTGDTLAIDGESSSFEGTSLWEVQDAQGKVRLDGTASAEGWVDGLYPWAAEVDVSSLRAGHYTLVARTDDPSGGSEGVGPVEDTRTFVVR